MNLKKTRNTPSVFLSIKDCIFEISGPSFADHITEIYTPILQWIEEEIPQLNCDLDCHFHIDILNSVSYKNIIEIIMRLDHYAKTGKQIRVLWYYYEDDEDNCAVGKDLSELFDIPFKVIKEKFK
ncbi:MAG: DUF1987 domain-containing protein [Bacteroidales bacterium]|nr:DUF1987 domain-containing protein [Bacteroidales bacterium]